MLTYKPQTLAKLKELAFFHNPHEAAGIIDGVGEVFLLTNLSENPHNSFEVAKEEVINIFINKGGKFPDQSTLWHSHPSGLIGPSRLDMQHKTKFNYHLVVTIERDDIILTWY